MSGPELPPALQAVVDNTFVDMGKHLDHWVRGARQVKEESGAEWPLIAAGIREVIFNKYGQTEPFMCALLAVAACRLAQIQLDGTDVPAWPADPGASG